MPAWIDAALQDLRYSARSLRRSPALAFSAILAATLGIGASTAVFSAVDRILFRPLPYRDEARLMSVGIMAPLDTNEFLLAEGYFALRRSPGPFEAVTAFQAGALACDLMENNPLRMNCLRAESNFLHVLGVTPAAGRSFLADEDRPNGPAVAMISYGLWSSRFARDPAVVGKTINLDGAPTRITGVLPRDFVMPTLAGVDVLLPLALDESRERSGRALRAFGKLLVAKSNHLANQELQPFFRQVLETVPPRFRREVTFRVRPVRDRQFGSTRQASAAVLGAVLIVLLIACSNIANLLLARAAGREQEMAVRRALGASPGRLARQVITESLLLGVTGAAAGCALAWALLRTLQDIAPDVLPRLHEAQIDLRVLAFAVMLSILSAVLFGIAPALRSGGYSWGAARFTSSSGGWLRGGLVTIQVALSLMLLTSAGLLLKTLWNLESVPLGIERDRVVTARFVLSRQRYSTNEKQLAFFSELERRLSSTPGISVAAISDSLPPSGSTRARPLAAIAVEGQPGRTEGTGGMVTWRYISPAYFGVLGVNVRRGRGFTDEDRAAGAQSVVISETLARQLFGNEDPLGRHILRDGNGPWFTVVGVAADARNAGLERAPSAEYYLVRKAMPDATFQQGEPPLGWRAASIAARTSIDPALAGAGLRSILNEIDPTLPVELETMRDRVERTTRQPRFYAWLLGAFAATGALLAAVGLFGVLSFLVARRRREIGVRIALGATPPEIARLTLGFAARWTGAGVCAGVLGSVAAGKWLQSMLFGVEPVDGGALAGAILLLSVVALAAAAAPAIRASRIDPMESLRTE